MNKIIYIMLAAILLVGLGLSCAEEPAPAPAPAPAPTPAPAPAPAPTPAPAAEPITIKLLGFLPKSHPMMNPLHFMSAKIEKNTNGQILVDYTGGPEVIPGFDQPEALRSGVIDANFYMPGMYMSSYMPSVFAAALSPYPAWKEREVGIYDLWDKIVTEKMNCKYLGRLESLVPAYYFYTVDVEAKKVSDFKGLNLRASALYISFLEKMEVAPVTLQAPEIATALSRGVIDGMVNAKFGVHSDGWDEWIKYMIEPGFCQADNFAVINLDTWNKIPPELQGVILDTFKDGEYICTAEMLYRVEADVAACKAMGMKVISLEPAEGEKLQDIIYSTIWEDIIKNAPEYAPQFKELMTQ